MTKLVLLHKADSIYDDEPDLVYDFPKAYLKAMLEALGDWVIYYEPVKAGARGYFAVARIDRSFPNRAVFERPVIERLTSRFYRDTAFRRKVREAYDYRCAISGLRLRNGGGRPEVQAAHIRPVERSGSDSVRNGIALSGTLHWMFDRGLVSVGEDHAILVSRNKVPSEVVNRLIRPQGRLWLPEDQKNWPHPENLRWHRENVFGQVMGEGPTPWD